MVSELFTLSYLIILIEAAQIKDTRTVFVTYYVKPLQEFAIKRLNKELDRLVTKKSSKYNQKSYHEAVPEEQVRLLTMPYILRYMLETDAITEKEVLKIVENTVLQKKPEIILPIEVQSKYVSVLMDSFAKSGNYLNAISMFNIFQNKIREDSKTFLSQNRSGKMSLEEKSTAKVFLMGELDPTWPLFYSYDMIGKEKILFDFAYRWNIPS